MNEQRAVGLSAIRIPLLVLIFLICMSVLLPLFAGCWKDSRDAQELNTAVQVCRSAAEAFAIFPDEGALVRALGGTPGHTLGYDRLGRAYPREDAEIVLSVSVTAEPTPAGELRTGTFTAVRGDKVLYTLQSSRYVSGAEGGEGHE